LPPLTTYQKRSKVVGSLALKGGSIADRIGRYRYGASPSKKSPTPFSTSFTSTSLRQSTRATKSTLAGRSSPLVRWLVMQSPTRKAESRRYRSLRRSRHRSKARMVSATSRAFNVYTSAITAWDHRASPTPKARAAAAAPRTHRLSRYPAAKTAATASAA
jgi:hypothetical protein